MTDAVDVPKGVDEEPTPLRKQATAKPDAVSPSRFAVELIFWAAVLVVSGYLVYGRVGAYVEVAPHGILGRMLTIVGAAVVGERAMRTEFRPVATGYLALVCLASLLWLSAWLWSRLGLIMQESDGGSTRFVRAQGLIAVADSALMLAPYWLTRAAGLMSRRAWVCGAVAILLSAVSGLLLNECYPKSWAFALGRIKDSGAINLLRAVQLAYWAVVIVFLCRIRRLRGAKWARVKS